MRPKTERTNRIRKCVVAGAVATALMLSAACSIAPYNGPNTSPTTENNAQPDYHHGRGLEAGG